MNNSYYIIILVGVFCAWGGGPFRPIHPPLGNKGKAFPLQACTGPWGSRISRQSAHEGGKIVSHTHRPSLPTGSCRKYPRHFGLYTSLPPHMLGYTYSCFACLQVTFVLLKAVLTKSLVVYISLLCHGSSRRPIFRQCLFSSVSFFKL